MSSSLVASSMIVLLLVLPVVAALSPASGSTELPAGEGERRPPSLLVPFRPARARLEHGGGGRRPSFDGRAAGGCMPRGFRRVPPSAPSRYVNYHTLDAGVCAHSRRGQKP